MTGPSADEASPPTQPEPDDWELVGDVPFGDLVTQAEIEAHRPPPAEEGKAG